MRQLILAAVMLALVVHVLVSSAGVLQADTMTASGTIRLRGGGRGHASEGVDLSVRVYERQTGGPFDPPPREPKILEILGLDGSSVGQTFTATPTSEPSFASFVTYLTNDDNDTIQLEARFSQGQVWLGSSYGYGHDLSFFHDANGDLVSLQSKNITAFDLHVDELVIDTTPEPPWTDHDIRVTLTAHYTPEPSTVALLTMAAVGLLAYGWRRRRKAA